MKWSHLPVAGGLYDQHPDLLEQWRHIFAKRNEYEERKRAEQERNKKNPPRGRGRVAGHR